MKKNGHHDDRLAAAAYARHHHAAFKGLRGNWTRKQWNLQIRIAIADTLRRLAQRRTARLHQ